MTETLIRLIDASDQVAALMDEISPALSIEVHRGDPDRQKLFELVQDAEVILNGHTYLDEEVLRSAMSLRAIVFLGTGAASYINLDVARELGISVKVIANYGDAAVAEHALALTLCAVRHVCQMDRNVRAGTWEPQEAREYSEMTVGVIGLGGIGRHFGSLAGKVGFKVIAWNRSPVESLKDIEVVELEELLLRSDVVSLHLGFNKNTAGFLDDKRLNLMKRDSILVNTARAELVETTALVRHLSAGTLGHAALDVFDHEPLPANDVLTRLPNVTLTAHAGFKTRSAMTRLLKMAILEAEKVASAQ